jgi:hypothetical protein
VQQINAWLAKNPKPDETDAVEAYRLLGLSHVQLNDKAKARQAFEQLLKNNPEYALDPFLVPPHIVELFDKVKQDLEPQLKPIREERRRQADTRRLDEEARKRLLAQPSPIRTVRVQERIYLFNWMPFGAGQFQNGHKGKGSAIAIGQAVLGITNVSAIAFHNQLVGQIAVDPNRRCPVRRSGCERPPYTDADRRLLNAVSITKYVSAGLFWGLYAYGVVDAHLNYVPRVETEVSPSQGGGTLKLSWNY